MHIIWLFKFFRLLFAPSEKRDENFFEQKNRIKEGFFSKLNRKQAFMTVETGLKESKVFFMDNNQAVFFNNFEGLKKAFIPNEK